MCKFMMVRYTVFAILLVVIFHINTVENVKVLGVFPMVAHSHFTIGFTLMKELANKGHQVTFINPFPQKKPIPNLMDVSVEGSIAIMKQRKTALFGLENQDPLTSLTFIFDTGNFISNYTLSSDSVQKLLKSNEKFDVIVMEEFFAPALMGFMTHFDAPIVMVCAMPANPWNSEMFGNPHPVSYIPHPIAKFSSKMSFFQRIHNAFLNIVGAIAWHTLFYPAQNKILHKYLPNAPHLSELVYNASLLLLNSHPSVNDPVPHTPNMIEIGGFHVSPLKELPRDLKEFLDAANEGVVYFSMGSNLKSAEMPSDKRDGILRAFGRIKQKVLWKFETDDLPGLPKNVKVAKWLPQQDVLAHPNIKAFISHGGHLSTIEAVYHGVPIIGIPIFGDQKANVAGAVEKGYAVAIPYGELSEDTLSTALDEILNNPKYSQNAKQRSKVMHDQPIKPLDSAVFWIEYVARHRGAVHFRSAALDLTWFQRSMLDIIIFLTIVTVVLFVIFYIIIKKILGPNHSQLQEKKDK